MKSLFIKILLPITILFTLNSCSKNEINDTLPEKQTVVVNYEYVTIETDLINLINDYRVNKGLNILKLDNYISKVSENHVYYLI